MAELFFKVAEISAHPQDSKKHQMIVVGDTTDYIQMVVSVWYQYIQIQHAKKYNYQVRKFCKNKDPQD